MHNNFLLAVFSLVHKEFAIEFVSLLFLRLLYHLSCFVAQNTLRLWTGVEVQTGVIEAKKPLNVLRRKICLIRCGNIPIEDFVYFCTRPNEDFFRSSTVLFESDKLLVIFSVHYLL